VSSDGNWWHVFTIDGATNRLKWNCKTGASMLQSNFTAMSKEQVFSYDVKKAIDGGAKPRLRIRSLAK